MNYPPSEFLKTDFGHQEYDRWCLKHARHHFFESPEFVKEHFHFYEKVLGLSKDDKILDAGCGIGSYSREFARRGYHVVGMDMSFNFLSEAERITQRENLEIEFLLGDYNELHFEEMFSVIFFEGSFFYPSKERLMSLLNRLYKALTLNGRLYFVHPNQLIREKQFPMVNWSEIEKNVFVLQRGEYNKDDGLERHVWLKIDLKTHKHYKCRFVLKHLSPDELKNCFVEAEFADFHFYRKRQIGAFHPGNDDGFSVVAKK